MTPPTEDGETSIMTRTAGCLHQEPSYDVCPCQAMDEADRGILFLSPVSPVLIASYATNWMAAPGTVLRQLTAAPL